MNAVPNDYLTRNINFDSEYWKVIEATYVHVRFGKLITTFIILYKNSCRQP